MTYRARKPASISDPEVPPAKPPVGFKFILAPLKIAVFKCRQQLRLSIIHLNVIIMQSIGNAFEAVNSLPILD
jgi:hypothetical protein